MNKNIGRKKKFFKELEGRFKVLQVVEIENLLSNQVIYSTIKTFPTCKKIEVDNSLFLEEDEYASLRLGSYIEDILLKDIKVKGRKKFKEYAKSDNSTINCKLDFCNKSLDYINISTMTKKSIDLVKELLQFIIEKNELPK